MYTMIRNTELRRAALLEGPALLISMLIAEVAYKFHSFTLECVAFLLTWLAVSALLSFARTRWAGKRELLE